MAELILALDLPDRGSALRLLDRLPALRWAKVGSQLMTAEGPPLVRELVARGLDVFLDLKWHDIPNTVQGAVASARALGVRMVTVHTLGGSAMLRAAAAAMGEGLSVVGVTVLTSHDELDYATALGRPSVRLLDEAARLARSAVSAGLSGIVCSPLEADRIRAGLGPDPLIVVPGIRRPGDESGDQNRTATPAEAIRDGATHLVVGRPILLAADPAAALDEFLAAF
ncbi:MAG TPA: orotidine-5'-phosphate decarboxylase [Gemmatimonadales bacterium]